VADALLDSDRGVVEEGEGEREGTKYPTLVRVSCAQ
jgi:hypothetical protein